jgi:hypothetical protein
MPQFGAKHLDIREQNVAVERVLAATENPRHRYLLQSYLRHRYLESARRYQRTRRAHLPALDGSTSAGPGQCGR